MDADELPGVPIDIKLRCPGCGWGFDMGLRELAQVPDGCAQEMHFTVCSKCFMPLQFNQKDGSDVRELTGPECAALPREARRIVIHMMMLCWLSARLEAPPQ